MPNAIQLTFLEKVVAAAGVARGTFYLYFASKEDLFRALAVEVATEMTALAGEFPPFADGPEGRAAIRDWLVRFTELYDRAGPVIRTWTEAEISDSEAQAQQARAEMASAEAEVSDRLAAAEDVLAGLQEQERQRLLDGVTIQETHFYRNGAQIDALRLHLLPDLMRRAEAESRPLRIWSAGCSTGEEPYTLAMLALEVRAALR